MKKKPVHLRGRAHRDIEAALDHYAREGGPRLASQFVDAVQAAFEAIGLHPGTGSPRYAHELSLPGLRSRKLVRFPYVLFYVERNDHIDVWRVLHSHSDIPAWLSNDE